MTGYFDYRFKTLDLDLALEAIAALRAEGLLGDAGGPENMLGDLIPGHPVRGRQGRADPPAGDPARWYFAIRTTVAPEWLPIDPGAFGLEPCPYEESLAVLGGWA